jgi:hypothetical protein
MENGMHMNRCSLAAGCAGQAEQLQAAATKKHDKTEQPACKL